MHCANALRGYLEKKGVRLRLPPRHLGLLPRGPAGQGFGVLAQLRASSVASPTFLVLSCTVTMVDFVLARLFSRKISMAPEH